MKSKQHLLISFGAILIFILFCFYLYQNNQKNIISSLNSVTATDIDIGIPPLRIPPTGFKEYRHLTYHFSFFYPDDLLVKEFKELGTAITITFQDSKGEKGFQIFVVPYGESQITEQRFKMDVPSGIRQEVVDVMIGEIRGIMFFSQNVAIGETREVWFIKGGFLYEVTTYKELDSWLSEIMQTWKFL